MTFACVDVGPLYGPEYVKRLWAGLRRHSSHRDMICFTDHPDEFTGFGAGFYAYDISEFMAVPVVSSGVPARWGCINLYAPLPGVDRLLYTDLDNVIIGDMDPLIDYARDKPFVAIREWGAAWTTMAAGVMAIECNTDLTRAVWDDYPIHGPGYSEYLFQGFTQRCLERHGLFDQVEFWPDEWVMSYKVQTGIFEATRNRGSSWEEARVCCLHGGITQEKVIAAKMEGWERIKREWQG